MGDDVQHELYATPSELPDSKVLIALARMSGQNALLVRDALLEGRFLVATGYLDQIAPLKAELEKLGVPVEVERRSGG